MIIKPIDRPPKRRRWAVITAAGMRGLELVNQDGVIFRRPRGQSSRYLLSDHVDYLILSTVSPAGLLLATDARYWSAKSWQGAITNLKMDGGPRVTPFKKVFDDGVSPYEIVSSINAFEKLMNDRGVTLGSFSSMAWNLWRTSLASPVTIYGPGIRDALYGGRKESIFPGEFKAVAYWDISAAYPNAQAAEAFPMRLRRVNASSDISTGMGLAFAIVTIPQQRWGPIPVKIGERAVCYGWGKAEGWWTWRDLMLAKNAGCDVQILDSFAGFNYRNIFGAWWKTSQPLRNEPGPVGALCKVVTSTLWGQFALSESSSDRIRWKDEWGHERITVPEPPRMMPHKFISHVAAETTSRVREKLWNEGLNATDAIYCDTDSVICGRVRKPDGKGWAEKKAMVRVDIRGPQTYRYLCDSCEENLPSGESHRSWHYVVGGVSSQQVAEAVFKREHRRHSAIPVSGTYDGLALPQMELSKARAMIGVK